MPHDTGDNKPTSIFDDHSSPSPLEEDDPLLTPPVADDRGLCLTPEVWHDDWSNALGKSNFTRFDIGTFRKEQSDGHLREFSNGHQRTEADERAEENAEYVEQSLDVLTSNPGGAVAYGMTGNLPASQLVSNFTNLFLFDEMYGEPPIERNGQEADIPEAGLYPTGGGFVLNRNPQAEAAYEQIRANPTDIESIARNTNVPPEVIARIKNHLFVNEHSIATNENEPDIRARFEANPTWVRLWTRAENGELNSQEREQVMKLLTHENVEATLEQEGLPIYEPDDGNGRPFKGRRAHDLAGIADQGFPSELVDHMPADVRQSRLRSMVSAALEVRGLPGPEEYAAMPSDVQALVTEMTGFCPEGK